MRDVIYGSAMPEMTLKTPLWPTSRNPPPDDSGIWVKTVCPDCLDANREARRRCKSTKGMCKGTGFTWKTA